MSDLPNIEWPNLSREQWCKDTCWHNLVTLKTNEAGDLIFECSLQVAATTISKQVLDENASPNINMTIVELFMARLLLELNQDLVPELLDRLQRHQDGLPQLVYEDNDEPPSI